MIVTEKFLRDNYSNGSAWTGAQFKVIGIAWPPKKGWLPKVIGSEITEAQRIEFIEAKNLYSKGKGKKKKTVRVDNSGVVKKELSFKTPSDFKTLVQYDKYVISRYKKQLKQSKVKRPKKKKKPKKISKRKAEYNKYLLSKEWATIKIEMRIYYNNQCQLCGGKKNLHVHHETYKNFGNEEPEDLMLVCQKCHKEIHKH